MFVCEFSGIFERKITIIKFGLAYLSTPIFLLVVPSVCFAQSLDTAASMKITCKYVEQAV